MLKIFKHSHFEANPFGHGGNKRTCQINELLTEAEIDFQDISFDFGMPTTNKIGVSFQGYRRLKGNLSDLKKNYAAGRYIKLFEDFIKNKNPDVLIWESTADYYLLLAETFHKAKIPVIAVPHNLESLVPGASSALSGKQSLNWLSEEIKYLSFCQKIFTISYEEFWLLSNLGINAEWLPYSPPREANELLLDIRRKRDAKTVGDHQSKNVLVLGTFYNKPTASGITELIEALLDQANVNLIVAGYGTEQLKSYYTAPNLQIQGTVSNQELSNLMIAASCAVIHQPASSGALTRIQELLVAGIPVFANMHAGRSCFHLQGITYYQSLDNLNELLSASESSTPKTPKPSALQHHFVDYIKQLAL